MLKDGRLRSRMNDTSQIAETRNNRIFVDDKCRRVAKYSTRADIAMELFLYFFVVAIIRGSPGHSSMK